jgi:YTH domain-containing family protein
LCVLGNNDNSWGGQHVRKSYDNNYYNNNNRGDYHQNDGGNKIEQRMQNMRLDSGSHSSGKTTQAAEHKEQGPKKTTWATIASQPAKPQISTTSTTIGKKKGFGPPPPMIPGKHSMELTDAWDAPKNGPLVPPSPPVIQAPQPDLNEKQNNSNFEGQPAWPTPGQAQNQNQAPQTGGNLPANQQQQQQVSSHQHQNNQRGYHPSQNNSNNNNSYQGGHSGGRQYNQNSGPHHQQYNSSHHYNDFQKPYHQHPHQMPTAPPQNHHQASAPITRSNPPPPAAAAAAVAQTSFTAASDASEDSILEQLRVKNQYNPSDLDLSQVDNAR